MIRLKSMFGFLSLVLSWKLGQTSVGKSLIFLADCYKVSVQLLGLVTVEVVVWLSGVVDAKMSIRVPSSNMVCLYSFCVFSFSGG